MEESASPAGRYRFGDFEFDSRTGCLSRCDGSGDGVHLPPQPAQLLSLLLERNGDLVGRDEIRDALWPDVHVDFDQSLNFCVHQVRTALGDSAGEPAYVETLPRRGYRLLQQAKPVATPGAATLRRKWLIAALAMLAATTLALIAGREFAAERARPVPTIAVMPFEPPPNREIPGEPGRIAETVLLELGSLGADRLGVIGPATTRAYAADPSLARLIAETGVDWVLNDRFIDSDTSPTGSGLLIEVIRASDGVHVWVESVDDATPTAEIVSRVTAAVRASLDLK